MEKAAEKTMHTVRFISDFQLDDYIRAATRNGYTLVSCDGNVARLENDKDITVLIRW